MTAQPPTLDLRLPDEIRTERLILRPYQPEDAEALFEAVEETRERLREWMLWVDGFRTLDFARDYCTRMAAHWAERTELIVGVWDAADGRYLGGNGFVEPNWDVRSFEIGYWIRDEGRGYVLETVRALCRFAFETLNANRVELSCDPRNTRSRRVPERLGFSLEGHLRNNTIDSDGHLRDSLVFALIPEDYARLAPTWGEPSAVRRSVMGDGRLAPRPPSCS